MDRCMIALMIFNLLAATDYSLVHWLGGGSILGVVVIFIVPKMFRK
jgi:hypothetical protein